MGHRVVSLQGLGGYARFLFLRPFPMSSAPPSGRLRIKTGAVAALMPAATLSSFSPYSSQYQNHLFSWSPSLPPFLVFIPSRRHLRQSCCGRSPGPTHQHRHPPRRPLHRHDTTTRHTHTLCATAYRPDPHPYSFPGTICLPLCAPRLPISWRPAYSGTETRQ